jgi:hypothetical protein
MTQADSTAPAKKATLSSLLLREWPFVLLYVLALACMGYTNADAGRSSYYWQLLIPVTGLVAIFVGWGMVSPNMRMEMILKQVLHWGAVLLVIRLLFLQVLDAFLSDQAHGFVVVYVFGLAAVLDGIHWNWKMAVFGAFLIFSAIVMAFFQDAALAISVTAALVAVAVTFLWSRFRSRV